MKSPFDNSKAFEPMLDEIVSVHAPRDTGEISCGFRACVMPIADAATIIGEMSTQSTRARFSVFIAANGSQAWVESVLGSRPQIGDRIELASGLKTSVVKVSPLVDSWYELETEQCP